MQIKEVVMDWYFTFFMVLIKLSVITLAVALEIRLIIWMFSK